MTANDAILTQEILPPYIGSAYSPQVEVTETTDGHNVAITYADGDTGITTVDFEVLNGEQGPQGETGAAAGFGAVSASVDDEVGAPSVTVTSSGPDTAKEFDFAFHNMKGETGDAAGFGAVSASVDANVGTPSVTVTSGGPDTAKTLDFAFKNLKGNKGDTGDAAGFGSPTASVDANVGTPSVAVTASGPNTAKAFNFAFRNLKGQTGAAAGFGTVSATVDDSTGTPSVEVTTSGEDTAKNFAFAFHNLKGEQGEPGDVQADGTYPMLHAGLADALSSSYGETATFAQRTSTRSGAVEIASLLGNTVRWNQLAYMKNVSLASTSASSYINAYLTDISPARPIPIISGHVYYVSADFTKTGDTSSIVIYMTSTASQGYLCGTANPKRIITAAANLNVTAPARFAANSYPATLGGSVDNFMLIDLTEAFGAGNEPSTMAEFEAMYPDDYYPFDAGSLKSVEIQGIRSVGFNQWDEQWETYGSSGQIKSKNRIPVIPGTTYYLKSPKTCILYKFADKTSPSIGSITASANATFSVPNDTHYLTMYTNVNYGTTYNHDICINISDPALNGTYRPYVEHTREIPASTYFPNGLRGAGSAHDALYADHADTAVGEVDLGTLSWVYDTDISPARFIASISDMVPNVTVRSKYLPCTRYECLWHGETLSETTDKVVFNLTSGAPRSIVVIDSAYTDAAAFKAAMSGVMLQYELATPTTQAIDPPLNLTYPVEAGGTESIVVPTGSTSAAPTFVTLYAYDADGIIDKTQSIIAQVENGVASTNYAVNSYLVMRGTLYRVTSAIATGENITPGTNCTATTVMAEIVRLTA